REDEDVRPAGSSKFKDSTVGRIVVHRAHDLFRLFGQTRPSRVGADAWWDGKRLPGGGKGWAHVVAIEPLGVRRMIDLQT
uniref:hypothetical protein n=1 Tax=Enterococcus faecium TaxID=1352 RepID=UPI003D9FDDD5